MDSPITRSMLQKQLLSHWAMLRPGVLPTDVLACVRCANPSAPTCKFHTDAKAFAFGSGRFDFEYASLWDTPHDMWFCCESRNAACEGCCEEPQHSTDLFWWRAHEHLAPPLASDSSEPGSGSDGSVENENSAMELDDD
mmetsp:Transcript_49838/g.80390  ORF Transcript_49838/g.80390 Transcript_49838/m.80390 type:complete len:139 (+) Transcript_49838:2-418(+)|eukprot:CAMPEP_0173131844 /NCGR_PEP_ID=MMETSP1102-20130122/60885_1 /TAXON_ID=49646 /ORGANISM="Geminigera sp., Strain Caron Lab Isolate" /LENGTH=138 /DNA_ID=CAMNT_0014043243 /DNA_START=6 /DNA_END=422 /DNA_ORIENTATION=+